MSPSPNIFCSSNATLLWHFRIQERLQLLLLGCDLRLTVLSVSDRIKLCVSPCMSLFTPFVQSSKTLKQEQSHIPRLTDFDDYNCHDSAPPPQTKEKMLQGSASADDSESSPNKQHCSWWAASYWYGWSCDQQTEAGQGWLRRSYCWGKLMLTDHN